MLEKKNLKYNIDEYTHIMDSEKIIENQNELRSGKHLTEISDEAVKYLKKPIGKAIYRGKLDDINNKIKKADVRDRIKCPLCNKEYTRWNKSHHEKTQYHKMADNIVSKITKFLVNE